jgi:hypothetical protein
MVTVHLLVSFRSRRNVMAAVVDAIAAVAVPELQFRPERAAVVPELQFRPERASVVAAVVRSCSG